MRGGVVFCRKEKEEEEEMGEGGTTDML